MVTISRPVLLDVNARVAGVVIRKHGVLVFDPGRSRTLASTGNVVVKGLLRMAPSSARRKHLLVFKGVDESRFEGGGMEVLKTDVGLWVMGTGRLALEGARKRAWIRATSSVPPGSRKLNLNTDPLGWRTGDEVAIVPTQSPKHKDHHLAYDYAVITSIKDRTITLSKATKFKHPAVRIGGGRILGAEVLNLTRNVRVEGTRGGRSHIFIHSSRPQRIRSALFRHMGPRRKETGESSALLRHMGPRRKESGESGEVLGRYGLHFHHCHHDSHGSLAEGVVVRDCGSHAFVPHESHGITFRRCISHNTLEEPYWWDKPPGGDTRPHAFATNDVLFDACVASLVRTGQANAGRLSGFVMGRGSKNVCRSCVAVGVQGEKSASGFLWPEIREVPVWVFRDCVAHNNRGNGIFVWQNTIRPHVISGFAAYHNSFLGIRHGAYANRYTYEDCILFGNLLGAIQVGAVSKDNHSKSIGFSRVTADAGGLSDYALLTEGHSVSSQTPVKVVQCTFRGYKKAAIGLMSDVSNSESALERFDVKGSDFEGNEFWLGSKVDPDSRVRVQDARHGSLELRRADQILAGEFRPEWNARVRRIDRF